LSGLTSRVRDESGFTLVELMAVILIISILVGIAAASYVFSTHAAKETTCRADVRILNEMVVKYYYDHGDWPDNLDDLVPDYIRDSKSLNCPDSGQPYNYDNSTGQVTCSTCPP
jgi:competence protein ComGC